MEDFKLFLETTAHQEAQKSLRRIPAAHRRLTRGFSFKFHTGDTLDGDDESIGKVVTGPRKAITVASPWYYPREFALLHEVGHLVWAKYVKGTPLEKKWRAAVSGAKKPVKQNDEELFCHSYAQYFSVNKMQKYNIPRWMAFVKSLPK